jgi:hypothetical protein
MASIVKANASLTAGGLAVLRREYSTTDDGTLNYQAYYCCLSQFANNHIGKFRTGAQPPTAIPASMSQLRIDGTPKLYDLTTNTQNGLTYFNARYSAASLDPGEVIVTESTEQRNFSATVTGKIRTPVSGFGGSSIVEGDVNLSFDYISTTVRVEAKNPRALPDIEGTVGLPFNVSVTQLQGLNPVVLGTYRASTVETTSKTRSSRGTYTYTKSSSGIYEVTARIL